MEKVVDNQELMERIKVDPIIYERSSKSLKFPEREKCMERNNLCTGSRYCISTSKVLYYQN